MSNALRLNEKDTVAVIPQHVNKGEEVVINGTAEKYILQDDIPAGHKFALKDFKEGELIYKYGIPIAKAKVDITKGSWVHDHNVIDNTEELCTKYINDYVNDEKTIDVFQRKNGKFGVANYILLVPTSARANIFAEKLAKATDSYWIVADKRQITTEDGLTKQARRTITFAPQNPNIYASVFIDAGEKKYKNIAQIIEKSGSTIIYIDLDSDDEDKLFDETKNKIETWKEEISRLKRVPHPIEGLKVSVHCGGSDWTTALAGNPALGVAADHITQNGGYIFMDEWGGFPGSEHILVKQAATRKLGLDIISKVNETRKWYIDNYGKPVEEINPYPCNKEGGITTLVEKSTGNIKKAGSSTIQAILEPGDEPTIPGVYLLNQDCLNPASTGSYGILSGAHINVFVTGVGYVYEEIPIIPDIRITGNSESFKHKEFYLDFNAGTALEDKTLATTGKDLFEFILSVASGGVKLREEERKSHAFIMSYPKDDFFQPGEVSIDNFPEKHQEKVDAIKQ